MTYLTLPLANLDNGIIMIAVFAAVCVVLVTAVLLLIERGSKNK